MKKQIITDFWENIEQLSSEELDAILRSELDSQTPDRDKVLLLLQTLEARDKNSQLHTNREAEQWESLPEIERKHGHISKNQNIFKKTKWLAVAAAVVLLIVLLLTPNAAKAETWLDILGRWTKDIFSFFDNSTQKQQEEYVFASDHEGLLQIYEVAAANGVTDPVVPMWLPDGYVLEEVKESLDENAPKIYARLVNGNHYVQFTIEAHSVEVANEYPKDDVNAKFYNAAGICYYLVTNENTWKVMWKNGSAECSIITNETEEVLYQLLNSIQRRGNQ